MNAVFGEKDVGVWLGACGPDRVTKVTSGNGGGDAIGYFSGCPDVIVLSAVPPTGAEEGGGDAPSAPSAPSQFEGSCRVIPLNLATKTLRLIVGVVVVLVAGSIFIAGILMFYRHRDSTNTDIYKIPSKMGLL